MKIYHHNDMDGFASASLIEEYFKNRSNLINIKKYEVNYKPNEWDNNFIYAHDETIFIVDYSFTESTKYILERLVENNCNIIWIDHHDSSVDFIKNNKKFVKNNFKYCLINSSPNISGAILTYVFLFKIFDSITKDMSDKVMLKFLNNSKHINNIRDNECISEVLNINIPRISYLRYISDYDTYALKFMPATLYFKLGYDNCKDSLSKFKLLKDLYNESIFNPVENIDTNSVMDDTINIGFSLYKFYKNKVVSYYKNFSYISEINNIKCIVINNAENNWIYLIDLIPDNIIRVNFVFDGKEYIYNLYSANSSEINCRDIAEKFGGGGHIHSAGFRSKKLLFPKVMSPMEAIEYCKDN